MTRKETRDGPYLDALSNRILGAGITVHSALGPGLLETAYEACLEHAHQGGRSQRSWLQAPASVGESRSTRRADAPAAARGSGGP